MSDYPGNWPIHSIAIRCSIQNSITVYTVGQKYGGHLDSEVFPGSRINQRKLISILGWHVEDSTRLPYQLIFSDDVAIDVEPHRVEGVIRKKTVEE